METIDFKNLSAEQEKILREILSICKYFATTRGWKPPVCDVVLADRAREIGWKMLQLEKV
jgi:hypothetical protein